MLINDEKAKTNNNKENNIVWDNYKLNIKLIVILMGQ
jgi:hypothetical protein